MKEICKASMYLALTILFIAMAFLVTATKRVVEDLPRQLEMTRVELKSELKEARLLIQNELGDTRKLVSSQVDHITSTTDDLVKRIDARIGSIQADLVDVIGQSDARLASIQRDVDQRAASIQSDLLERTDSLLKPVEKTLERLDNVIYETMVCFDEELQLPNPHCLPNKIIGMAQSAERMADAGAEFSKVWAEAAPLLVQSVNTITVNSATITSDVKDAVHEYTHPPLYRKIVNIGIAAGPMVWVFVKNLFVKEVI